MMQIRLLLGVSGGAVNEGAVFVQSRCIGIADGNFARVREGNNQ
jgi:hypothetical protein